MTETPITDALSTDPAIEKRDVPARVWIKFERLERDRAELIALIKRQTAAMNNCPMGDLNYAGINWLNEARALLARLEKE